jgi:hypothetical protein
MRLKRRAHAPSQLCWQTRARVLWLEVCYHCLKLLILLYAFVKSFSEDNYSLPVPLTVLYLIFSRPEMSEWLDDLSEDWPSQPPSVAGTINSRPAGSSVSRIPRSIHGKFSAKPSKLGGANSVKNGVLKERSSSGENIIAGTPRSGAHDNKKHDTLRSSSEGSSPRMQNTVERKSVTPSPAKPRSGVDETPEWKRRLLMGEMDYGQKKDLFAPTGIQSLFQKPLEQSSEEQRPRNLSFLKHLDAMPSSPPWPLSSMLSGVENQLDSIAELDTVEEAEEQSLQTNRTCFGRVSLTC